MHKRAYHLLGQALKVQFAIKEHRRPEDVAKIQIKLGEVILKIGGGKRRDKAKANFEAALLYMKGL